MVERLGPKEKDGWIEKYKKLNILTAVIFLAAGLPVLAAVDAAQILLINAYQKRKKKSNY